MIKNQFKGLPFIRKYNLTSSSSVATSLKSVADKEMVPHDGSAVAITENEIRVLRSISFDRYRVDLYLFRSDWREKAGMAADEAAKLDYPLELALFFDENFMRQSDEFAAWIEDRKPMVAVINLFHKNEAATRDWFTDHVASRLKQIIPQVRMACGTNANFAQLNGHFPSSGLLDQICYSVHPQEHASDNSTMVENLRSQSDSVLSARHYSGGKDILVSTVNIQRRFNANIENFETVKPYDSMPSQVDTLQMSLFCAGWTAISLKYLGETGTKGVTYFETAGERGIFQGDFNSRWPEEFKSINGMIFPEFIFQGFSGQFRIKQLNSDTFADAALDNKWSDKNRQNPSGNGDLLELEPYSVSFIDGNI